MKLILFSKMLKGKSMAELAELGGRLGLDGYDLAVRPGYPVNPGNVGGALPTAARVMRAAGLDIPMLTGNFDLLEPSHPAAEPILGAMDEADVRLVKLGYFRYDPATMDYWAEVDRVRRSFEGWARLAEKHRVKVCYHTHSNRCMGLNAGMLAHLIHGLDSRHIGAYLDTGHLVAEGEEFAVAAAIVRPYLSIVSLKDFLLVRQEKDGHGAVRREVVEAGRGMVDWTAVFAELERLGYRGPGTIHCEFQADDFDAAIAREVAFFRARRQASGLG